VAKKKAKPIEPELVGFLGVGLDNEDGHDRLTQSEHFLLVGGSDETHDQMQDLAICFEDLLDQRGKDLRETTVEEAIELLRRARERTTPKRD
jgi:hypothetical protein